MTTWHVATTGRDSAAGTEAAPLRTIKAGIAKLKPGDVVLVAPGTYAEAVVIDKSGSAAGGDVTLRSAVKGAALIRPPSGSWNAVNIYANYVTVDGVEIVNAPGDGIEGNDVHHVTVRDCTIHGCGESGVQFNRADWLMVERNECYENAAKGWFSGISVYQCRALAEGTGDRVVIRGNVCRDNVTRSGPHTDGNGVIVDDCRNAQDGNGVNYPGPILVEGNLCHGNGGKGVQVYLSDKVTVRRNTCVGNNRDAENDGTYRGEISNQAGAGNVFEGNIAVAKPGTGRLVNNSAIGSYTAGAVWRDNVTFNGTPGQPSVSRGEGGNALPSGTNRLGVNPKLVSYVPTAAGMAEIGWRPATIVTPEPEEDMEAVIAALQEFDRQVSQRLAALEARPTDPEIAGRVAALEAEISTLKAFDQKVKDL